MSRNPLIDEALDFASVLRNDSHERFAGMLERLARYAEHRERQVESLTKELSEMEGQLRMIRDAASESPVRISEI